MQKINYLLILLLVTDISTQLTNADCKNVSCLKGQECRFVSNRKGDDQNRRKKECSCIIHCPRKFKRRHKRICGSDGFAYESECHLYRYACRSGEAIVPLFKDRTCLKDPFIKLKKIINQAAKEIRLFEEEEKKSIDTIQVPVACNQNERNNMREYIIDYVTKQGQRNLKGMSYHRVLSRSFKDMDTDNDTNVDSIEMFNYVHKKTETKKATPTTHNDIIIELERQENFGGTSVIDSRVDERKLCMDALVEEGDANKDWRLSKSEYILLLNRHYRPSDKYCIKDRKMFEDGTTIRVDCNGCICACGKWICTARSCSTEKFLDQTTTETFEDFSYDDMDNQIE